MTTIEKLDNHTQHLLGHDVCPSCGSPEIECNSVDFFTAEITQKCWCLECDKSWVDSYKLVNYEWAT